jgi:type IV secretion system protein VirB5
MYTNVVGKRDIAGIMSDKLAQQYLPADLQQIAQLVRSGKGASSGISGNLDDIVRMNQARDCALYGAPATQARCKAEWQSYAMKQYVGETGYSRATSEINDLTQFVDRIKDTEDPKAMQDLQARIQLSQVKVQAEMNKLQYLQQAEKAREEMSRRNSIDNTVKMLKPGMVRF